MWRLVVVLCSLALAGRALADPRIVIVQTRDAPRFESLATQIRVYAGQQVEVVSVDRPELGTAFAGEAASVLTRERATAIVWVAPLPEDGSYLVFAAGRWPGRALIELVRIPPGTSAGEAERSIALKIGALLDSLLVARAPAQVILGLPTPRPAQLAAPTTATWSLGVAGAVVGEQGDRGWEGRLAARLGYARGRLGGRLEAYWQPAGELGQVDGRAVVYEVGLRASAALHHRGLFAGPHLVVGAQHAWGLNTLGQASSATVLVPALGVDVGITRTLAQNVRWVLEVAPEVALIRQRFLVNGQVIADLERLRFALVGGLAIDL